MGQPRRHHYVPRFYLRNFAIDPEKRKIAIVTKRGPFAIWKVRSIKQVGYDLDLYVHSRHGTPVSVECDVNRRIETPISRSDTWAKIESGRTDALDSSDKPILYSLIRHLEVRTPHYLATSRELAQLAASDRCPVQFTEREREYYARVLASRDAAKSQFDHMASSLEWTEQEFLGCGLSILRSPIPLRSSTTPVLVTSAPAHPKLRLPLPGMVPFQRWLALNKHTIASLVVADFEDGFLNSELPLDAARTINRHFVAQFAFFREVRHLIADRGDDLTTDMTWAPYDLVQDRPRKMIFRRHARDSS